MLVIKIMYLRLKKQLKKLIFINQIFFKDNNYVVKTYCQWVIKIFPPRIYNEEKNTNETFQ